jgi:hypothetical protein
MIRIKSILYCHVAAKANPERVIRAGFLGGCGLARLQHFAVAENIF